MTAITVSDRLFYLASAFFNIRPDQSSWVDAHELQWEDDQEQWINKIPNNFYHRLSKIYHRADRWMMAVISAVVALFFINRPLAVKLFDLYESGRDRTVMKVKRYKGFYSKGQRNLSPEQPDDEQNKSTKKLRDRIKKLQRYFAAESPAPTAPVRRMYRGNGLNNDF